MHHPIMGMEHLHRHSDFSLLDGFGLVEEYAQRSREINQKYLCITDHGVMGAIPKQISCSEEYGLFPIFGCETYINRLQPKVERREESAEFRKNLSESDQKLFDKSSHLLLIAYNNKGYHNLVRLTSWAWRHGFYKKPRINWDILMENREGLIATSTCANSEIANAFLRNMDDQEGFDVVEQYMAAFGDKFFLELMMLDYKLQKPYDAFLIRAHAKYDIPLILTQDCFVKGTLILTNNGFKPIEEIKVGDLVLTHKNRFKPVEVVFQRPIRENELIYRVKTPVGSYAFDSTGDHKIYTATKTGAIWSYNWKKVKDITAKKDFLVVPKISEDAIFANCGDRSQLLHDFFEGRESKFEPSPFWSDLGDSWAVVVTDISPVEYNECVFDMQVQEDHSYTANMYKVSNCHYCYKENSKHQQLMLMMQNNRTIHEIELLKASGADVFELQDENLWMKSEDELNEKWELDYKEIIDYELYKQSKANTVRICEMARGVQIDRSIKLPQMDHEKQKLIQAVLEGVEKRNIPKTRVYLDRIKEELDLINKKGFASYFLIQKMMVDEARRICPELIGFGDGSEAVGPGRGSACGSLVAYCIGLHDVNPVDNDLLFSRFLSPSRGGKQMKIRFIQSPKNIEMKTEKIEPESARELTGQI